MKASICQRQRAFTLVELLVVIGIIAVLISILLPALSRANEAAKSLKCSANMRGIGQAILLFANEFKGRPPGGASLYRNNTKGTVSCAWQVQLNIHVFNTLGVVPARSLDLTRFPAKLYCPSFYSGGPFQGSYSMNTYVQGPSWQGGGIDVDPATIDPTLYRQWDWGFPDDIKTWRLGRVLSNFKNTSEKVMLFESELSNNEVGTPPSGTNPMFWDATIPFCASNVQTGSGGSSNMQWANWNRPAESPPDATALRLLSFRHLKKTNILYVDGHVETLELARDMGLSRYWVWNK